MGGPVGDGFGEGLTPEGVRYMWKCFAVSVGATRVGGGVLEFLR